MKLYRICWREGVWQVSCGDEAIAMSEKREELIQLARQVAVRHDGELYVCDKAGKLEVTYFYKEGTECVRLVPRLRVVRKS